MDVQRWSVDLCPIDKVPPAPGTNAVDAACHSCPTCTSWLIKGLRGKYFQRLALSGGEEPAVFAKATERNRCTIEAYILCAAVRLIIFNGTAPLLTVARCSHRRKRTDEPVHGKVSGAKPSTVHRALRVGHAIPVVQAATVPLGDHAVMDVVRRVGLAAPVVADRDRRDRRGQDGAGEQPASCHGKLPGTLPPPTK